MQRGFSHGAYARKEDIKFSPNQINTSREINYTESKQTYHCIYSEY